MKINDIVTVVVNGNQATNTYIIDGIYEETCVLKHPLNNEIRIVKNIKDLNTVQVEGTRSPTENCLWYCKKNEEHLDFDKKSELKALCLHFIVYKVLSNSQKKALSDICGYIAGIMSQNDLDIMIRLVYDNVGILDSYNTMWYNNYKDIFEKKKPIKTKSQKYTVQNMAGFCLAQLYA